MKTDIEMLHEYIEETDKGFYESISDPEKILYQCVVRDSLQFAWYVFRKRCEELGTLLKQEIKKFGKGKRIKKATLMLLIAMFILGYLLGTGIIWNSLCTAISLWIGCVFAAIIDGLT